MIVGNITPLGNNVMFFHTFAYTLWKRDRKLPRTRLVIANEESYPMWMELATDKLITVECDSINIFKMRIEFTDAGYELASTFISFGEL